MENKLSAIFERKLLINKYFSFHSQKFKKSLNLIDKSNETNDEEDDYIHNVLFFVSTTRCLNIFSNYFKTILFITMYFIESFDQ